MGSLETTKKPHAVCIQYPAQGHINPMLKLAKLLHFKGSHITFVNTEYNHKRLLKARGPDSLNGLSSFRFETIPDGLPEPVVDATQDITSQCDSTRRTCLPHFKKLLTKINNSDVPPVSCIVSDGGMSSTLDAAEELGVPEVMFWTPRACGFMCHLQYQKLIEKGLMPLKDSSYVTNRYLETTINWVPGIEEIRLNEIPGFIRTTNLDDIMLHYLSKTKRTQRASAIILNIFDALEHDVLEAFPSILPPVYCIGPLNLLVEDVDDEDLKAIGSNLWKEESECMRWLETKEPNSFVYVNLDHHSDDK